MTVLAAPASLWRRVWAWLTVCAEPGCTDRPERLGWCGVHAPPYEPGPDEYFPPDPPDA